MQILFQGETLATPTAATILIEGESVFSGQIGAGQPLDTTIDIANVVSDGGAVSISVTSGILNVAQVFKWPTTAPAWDSSIGYSANSVVLFNGVTYQTNNDVLQQYNQSPDSSSQYNPWQKCEDMALDCRENILINGQPPEWPATPVNPMPGGTPENPDWSGWAFEVSAGETITFTV